MKRCNRVWIILLSAISLVLIVLISLLTQTESFYKFVPFQNTIGDIFLSYNISDGINTQPATIKL